MSDKEKIETIKYSLYTYREALKTHFKGDQEQLIKLISLGATDCQEIASMVPKFREGTITNGEIYKFVLFTMGVCGMLDMLFEDNTEECEQ